MQVTNLHRLHRTQKLEPKSGIVFVQGSRRNSVFVRKWFSLREERVQGMRETVLTCSNERAESVKDINVEAPLTFLGVTVVLYTNTCELTFPGRHVTNSCTIVYYVQVEEDCGVQQNALTEQCPLFCFAITQHDSLRMMCGCRRADDRRAWVQVCFECSHCSCRDHTHMLQCLHASWLPCVVFSVGPEGPCHALSSPWSRRHLRHAYMPCLSNCHELSDFILITFLSLIGLRACVLPQTER
jgi:hypothetical protein